MPNQTVEQTITATPASKPKIGEVLTNTPFMLLFSAQFTQNIGSAVSWLALQFLLFKLTESPGLMGILSIIFWLPYVLFTPFAGVFVDRYDQRKLLLFSNLLSFVASFGYIIIYLFLNELMKWEVVTTITETGTTIITRIANPINIIWPIFILVFLNSTAASIFFPTRNAYTRLIVKKKNLLIANSIGSTVFQIATIVGYVIAGVLAGRSYLGSFIFDASTYAFSATMIVFILLLGQKPPEVVRPKEETIRAQIKGVFDDLMIGYRTIRDRPKITYLLIIFASAIFSFSAFNVLFIVILQGEMGLNETWYGILQSIMGVSGIATSLFFMSLGMIKRKIRILNFALIGATIFLGLFSFIRNAWGIAVLLFAFGVVIATINVTAPTLIQEQVSYEKQGRVFGTQQLFQGIARLIGMGIVSIIAEYVIPMYVLLAGAVLLACIMIWALFYSRKKGLTKVDDQLEDVAGLNKN